MQRMQRQFGKFMKRSTDDTQVAVLLQDFEEADKLLARVIDSTSAWRDAWTSLLTYQSRMVHEFEGLYAPIVGSAEPTVHVHLETPRETLDRTSKLKEDYEELRNDLMGEINAIDDRMINPTNQAKDFLMPLKKTIKKREDRKLDFERCQSRYDSASKKTKRSDRENAALAKAETGLAQATEDYNAADDHLRRILPPLIAATFSLLPRLLATQIEIQNSLLANYYTIVYNYCQEYGFPTPAPEMDDIMDQLDQDQLPAKQEIESFAILASGKSTGAARPSVSSEDQHGRRESNLSVNGRPPSQSSHHSQSGSYRRPSGASPHPQLSQPPSPGRPLDNIPDNNHYGAPPPILGTKPPLNGHLSASQIPSSTAISPGDTPRQDYFSQPINNNNNNRRTSSTTNLPVTPGFTSELTSAISSKKSPSDLTSAIAAKKKKPPPPPPSRGASQPGVFVTALYDFGGQSDGDLSFREGDRIRVVKKTESTDDWWEGQLRGITGSFPANYVQ